VQIQNKSNPTNTRRIASSSTCSNQKQQHDATFITRLSVQDISKTHFLQSCVYMFYMCPTWLWLQMNKSFSQTLPHCPCSHTASAIGPMLAWAPSRGQKTNRQKTPETVLNLHCNACPINILSYNSCTWNNEQAVHSKIVPRWAAQFKKTFCTIWMHSLQLQHLFWMQFYQWACLHFVGISLRYRYDIATSLDDSLVVPPQIKTARGP